jgi:PAS domain S-box-containing protein
VTYKKHQKRYPAALLAAIVDSADDVIISKTLDGTVTSWNRAAERTFGYNADEAIGGNIKLIVPTERHSEEDEILSRVGRGERVEHFRTIRRAKDGHRVDVSITVSPVRNRAGEIIGASNVARDISIQKKIESEREEALARAELAYRHAQEADRAKDEFLATLSHELRSPLNAIVNWASLLISGNLNGEKVRHAYAVILRNAQMQTQLVSDLLDVSRIISGKLCVDLEPVDVVIALQLAIDAVRPTAEAKGVQLQAVSNASVGMVMGDIDRLQQIFWNLITNGVKFTPKNGHVRVLAEKIDSDIVVTITDTGIGIAQDILPHIFERFRQGNSGSARPHGGLGLGLAIVRYLVEQHGGSVAACSAGEEQGSTFTLRFPIAAAKRFGRDDHRGEHDLPESLPPRLLSRLKHLRMLFVDDERDTRDLIAEIFSHSEAEVRLAASAAEALEILGTWLPDVLVADIGMPGEDGYAFLQKLRARSREQGGQVPAVALTAYARRDDRLRVLASGFQMYLPKPVQPIELLTVVANFAHRF